MSKLIITDDLNVLAFVTDAVLTLRRVELETAEAFVTSALYGDEHSRAEVLTRLSNGVIVDALNHARSFGKNFSMRAVAHAPVEMRGGDAVLLVSLPADSEFDQFGGVSPTYLVEHNPRYLNRLDAMLDRAVKSLRFEIFEIEIEVESLGERHQVELTTNVIAESEMSH
jgi:hypothetical protein